MKKKIKNKKTGVLLGLTSLATVIAPVITHSVDKKHERDVLKEQHDFDIRKLNTAHLHSTHGFRVAIDNLKKEIKMVRDELAIARGALGESQDANLKSLDKIMKLEKELTLKQKLLNFYVHK